ncbi:MAG: hypothetical protein GC151_13465 [Betaproteobacteria bacterium]|nr:hypothetical protein [Betaproteobacteria bacterium]
MALDESAAGAAKGSRTRPLIEPVSIEEALEAARVWTREDRALTDGRGALNRAIKSLRASLEKVGLDPSETAGDALPTPDAVLAAMGSADKQLSRAVSARVNTRQACTDALLQAEAVLQNLSNLRLARVVTILLAVLLAGGLVFLLIHG